jgi:hypothetical protein
MIDALALDDSYGRQLQMTAAKISTFFSVIRTVHNIAAGISISISSYYCWVGMTVRLGIERIDSAPPSLSVSWSLFEEIILRHSVERAPFSIQMFTLHDLRSITDWTANK